MKKVLNKKNFYILGALFIGILFFYFAYNTPLAGDDWGYALGGNHPIKNAIGMYNSWSGRFFSELWGYLIAPRKYLWNIINPILFMAILVGIYYLCNIQNKYYSCVILIIALMLNVSKQIRMETYTWIMGNTYVVPLCLSIYYFAIIRKLVSTRLISGRLKVAAITSNILLFIIGLMMENIAATMILSIIILIVYAIMTRRYLLKYLIPNLLISIISFLIMRLSPGSTYRLQVDNAEFNKLNIIDKIVVNYPNFIEQSFTNNYYIISIFALIVALYLIFEAKEKNILLRYVSITIQLITIFVSFSFLLGNSFLNDGKSIFSMIYWPLYVIDIYLIFIFLIDDHVLKERSIFYITIAGSSVISMLLSPVYGPRSSLYLVYYLIILSVIIFDYIKTNRTIGLIFMVFYLLLVLTRSYRLINKYHLVGLRENERQEIIKYYIEHPEDEEVYIPRMPIETIHSADIEPNDIYHLEVFKQYYNLPQKAENIKFYYVEDK